MRQHERVHPFIYLLVGSSHSGSKESLEGTVEGRKAEGGGGGGGRQKKRKRTMMRLLAGMILTGPFYR